MLIICFWFDIWLKSLGVKMFDALRLQIVIEFEF